MNILKRILAAVLIVSVMLSFSSVASADENSIKTYEYTGGNYLSTYSSNALLEETLTDAWSDFDSVVNVLKYKLKVNDLSVYYEICNLYPEYFYIDSSVKYDCNLLGYINNIYIQYIATKEVCISQSLQLENTVDNILLKMNEIKTDEDKVVFIHDYISTHTTYYSDAFSGDADSVDKYSYNAYGCLVNGVAVCQGMSDSFILLCKKVGIEASLVSSSEMNHAWNLVKLGENYYHLDITWDDSGSEAGIGFDGENFIDVKGFASHKYFLKSDEQMLSLEHYSWEDTFSAADNATYNNYYWDNVYSHIYFIDGFQYFIKNSKLIKRNADTGEEKILYTIANSKFSVDGTNYVWNSKNAVLSYNYSDKFLLMNLSDGVYAYNIVSDEITKVFDYSGNGYIAGIFFENKTLYYDIVSVKNNKLYKLGEGQTEIELPEEQIVYGDLNRSGNVDIADVLEMRKYLCNYGNDIDKTAADVNKDNSVDLIDLLLLYRYLLNYDVTLGG